MTETFPIVPGQARMLWFVVPIALLVLGTMGVLGWSLASARRAYFEVSPAGLRLHGDLYGRLVPARALRLAEARAVDLNTDPALRPTARTNGTAFPGYRSGWFRLRGGGKALLYVTDPRRVAYIPTTEGYALLLSVADPDTFLASLRRATAP